MNIGIATWFGSDNFGTNLQCYAFYQYLQSQGHETYIIPCFQYGKLGFKCTLVNFWHSIKRFLSNTIIHRGKYDIIDEYTSKHLNIYPMITTKRGYHKLLDHFDCFFSGSDQIWNPFYLSSFYLLDFAKSKPRFAYASSLGVSEIPLDKSYAYKKELRYFKYIGIREKTGADLVNRLLGENKAVQVLDPTFLLSRDEWHTFSKEIDTNGIELRSYMFVYIIGNRDIYPNYIKNIQQHYNISNIVCVKSAEGGYYSDATLGLNKISPMQFVYLLMNARLVCTDSFHATALSINMNLNFIELLRFEDTDKCSQNSRIYDLLNHYLLSDRIYEGANLPDENIDYCIANSTLAEDRKKSVRFIDDCLNAAKININDERESF